MKIEKQEHKFYTKEEVLEKINAYHTLIVNHISFSFARITIHLYNDDRDDYPRMVFALSSIAYSYSRGASPLSQEDKERIVRLFWSLHDKAKGVCDEKEKLYVLLYGIQMLSYLKAPHDILVEEFKHSPYKELFTYPVMTYCFMTAYIKSDALKDCDYAGELFLQAKKVFDYYLYSNKKEEMLPFYFAELSYHEAYIEKHMLKRAESIIVSKLPDYLKNGASASGVAKCMEHFARIQDLEHFRLCEQFLQKERNVSKFAIYSDKKFSNYSQYMYTESEDSQYMCLDTFAHLLMAFSTLYTNSHTTHV